MTDRGVGAEGGAVRRKLARLYHEVLFKAEYFYGDAMPHWLARCDNAVRLLHPDRLFLGRHKIERYRMWFRDELSAYLKDIFLDTKTLNRPYLNKGYVHKIINEHIHGTGNYTHEINRILTMELIQRTLIER
jgi:asparagine synthase (glutamine-hydrolysing)